MRDAKIDGRLQVTAGLSLLQNSRLVEWVAGDCKFVQVPKERFESSFRTDIDPVFGRLICWINFSAGSEFLAKGLCLLHGVDTRTEKTVPAYPTDDIDNWVSRYRQEWKSAGTMTVTDFGTLGNLLYDGKGKVPPLSRLCEAVGAKPKEEDLLFAGYQLLMRSIRNRDVHAYVPNVRDSHYNLVPELFTRCFNLLVSWLPDGPTTLNRWKAEAKSFLECL